MIRSPYIFKCLDNVYQERIVEAELVHRMASKWEKVVDKAASLFLGRKLIICGRSAKWWDEELFCNLWRIIGQAVLKI